MKGMLLNIDTMIEINKDSIIKDIVVIHVSALNIPIQILYYPGMEDIFYICKMKKLRQTIDLDIENTNLHIISRDILNPNYPQRLGFELYHFRLMLARSIHNGLRKLKGSTMHIGPLTASLYCISDLFQCIDRFDNLKSNSTQSKRCKGLYDKNSENYISLTYSTDICTRILSSIDCFQGYLGTDWYWQLILRKGEDELCVKLPGHSIRKVRSDDEFSKIEVKYNVMLNELYLDFNILNETCNAYGEITSDDAEIDPNHFES
jgi:hypothetical protein